MWNIYITVPDVFDKGKDSLKTFRPPFISRINLVIPSLDSTPSTAYAASNGYSSPHAGSSGYKWAGAAAAAVSALAALAFLATPAKDPNEGKEKTTAEAKAAADLKATLEEVAAARRKLEEAARQKQEAGRRAAAAQQARPEQMTVQQPKSSAKERVAEFYREITHLNNISLYDIMDFKGRRAEDFLLGGDDGRNVMDTLRAPRARPTAVDAGMPQISAAMIIESILGAKLKDIRGNVSIAHTPKELAWWYDVGPAQEKFVLYRDMGAGTTTILFRNDVGVDQIKVIAKSADTGTLNVGELLGKNGKRFEFIADCAQRGDFTDKCKELVSKLSPSK